MLSCVMRALPSVTEKPGVGNFLPNDEDTNLIMFKQFMWHCISPGMDLHLGQCHVSDCYHFSLFLFEIFGLQVKSCSLDTAQKC